jgi:hypothetical protein
MVAVLDSARRSFPANTSYDDFSNARTPQNRDSYESVFMLLRLPRQAQNGLYQ